MNTPLLAFFGVAFLVSLSTASFTSNQIPDAIAAPGEKAIEAALKPADGPWLYFVTTDPSNGAMSFASTYKQHQRNVRKFQAYCRTHSC